MMGEQKSTLVLLRGAPGARVTPSSPKPLSPRIAARPGNVEWGSTRIRAIRKRPSSDKAVSTGA